MIKGEINMYEKQLLLNQKTLSDFKDLNKSIKAEAKKAERNPYLIAQLTHSGRFGENNNIVFRDEYLDEIAHLENGFHKLSDSDHLYIDS